MLYPPMVYIDKNGYTDRIILPNGTVVIASQVSRKKFKKALFSLVGQQALVVFEGQGSAA